MPVRSEPIDLSLIWPVVVLILAIFLRRPLPALILGTFSTLLLLSPAQSLSRAPIVMPLAYALQAANPLTTGVLLSASACGSQACFYLDSSVLATQGAASNLVIAQYPDCRGSGLRRFGARRLSRARGKETCPDGPYPVWIIQENNYRVVTLHKLVRLPKGG